jgi:hypothetical protein
MGRGDRRCHTRRRPGSSSQKICTDQSHRPAADVALAGACLTTADETRRRLLEALSAEALAQDEERELEAAE